VEVVRLHHRRQRRDARFGKLATRGPIRRKPCAFSAAAHFPLSMEATKCCPQVGPESIGPTPFSRLIVLSPAVRLRGWVLGRYQRRDRQGPERVFCCDRTCVLGFFERNYLVDLTCRGSKGRLNFT
jgi:hypothetical protein